jgi:hypothetical protein
MRRRAVALTRTVARAVCAVLAPVALTAPVATAALGPALPKAPPAIATPEPPSTSARIAPSLSPNRLGARAALTFTTGFAGGEFGVPSPLRRSVLRFPAGMSVDIPSLHACSARRLRALGPSGCPARSEIGRGSAFAEVLAGSELLREHVAMWAFVGPLQNSGPTVEILARGHTPFDKQVVLTGRVLPDSPPYGEKLVLSIPAIHTLRFEPDASMRTFSLTLGADRRQHPTRNTNAIVVPASCPPGGFPFAAEFTYADGSGDSALTTTPCPPSPAPSPAPSPSQAPSAHAAGTISLNESGQLHLISRHGFTLSERGAARGTIAGTIYVRLTIASTSRVTAEVSIYRSDGSISGYATASYRKGSTMAGFSGSMVVTRGSGRYRRAHGSGLSFNGTIQRSNYAVTVSVNGRLSA